MRVIAGIARSMPLRTVKGMDVRPTTDRTKETLFNIIQMRIPDCRFLDLYAGSGSIGIEALSRGARECVFVEKARASQELVKENLRKITLASNHLLTLINDILDISKVESGKLNLVPQSFSIVETVENLMNLSQPMIKEKNIDFSFRAHISSLNGRKKWRASREESGIPGHVRPGHKRTSGYYQAGVEAVR